MDFSPELISFLSASSRVTVLTGAGVSQESGLSTFRDPQAGIWAQYRPEDLATPVAFARDPHLVWQFYASRRERARQAQPNPGHLALAHIEQRVSEFILLTQNVDGLHQRAGSQRVVELHGNIHRVRCSATCGLQPEPVSAVEKAPLCPYCGAFLRPDVVWFGESLSPAALDAAWSAANTCQAFFSIGTSGLVQPAASLAALARKRGALVVEINLDPTPLTPTVDFFFQGKSGEILPELVKALW